MRELKKGFQIKKEENVDFTLMHDGKDIGFHLENSTISVLCCTVQTRSYRAVRVHSPYSLFSRGGSHIIKSHKRPKKEFNILLQLELPEHC